MKFNQTEKHAFQSIVSTFRQAEREARAFQKTIVKQQRTYYRSLKRQARLAKREEKKQFLLLCKGAAQMFRSVESKLRTQQRRAYKQSLKYHHEFFVRGVPAPPEPQVQVKKRTQKPMASKPQIPLQTIEIKEQTDDNHILEESVFCYQPAAIVCKDPITLIKKEFLNYVFLCLRGPQPDFFFIELDMNTLQPILRMQPEGRRNEDVYQFAIHNSYPNKFDFKIINRLTNHTSFQILVEDDITRSIPKGLAELRQAIPRNDSWRLLVEVTDFVNLMYPFISPYFIQSLY